MLLSWEWRLGRGSRPRALPAGRPRRHGQQAGWGAYPLYVP